MKFREFSGNIRALNITEINFKSFLQLLNVYDTNLFFLEYLSINKLGMAENDESEITNPEFAKAVINFLPENWHLPREVIEG